MAKYNEEDILKIVRSVIAALENDSERAEARESMRTHESAEEEMAYAGYAETIEDDSTAPKTYKAFNSRLCIAIGDGLLKNMISIGEGKSIIRALEDFVHSCEPDFHIEKIGECNPEDLACYTYRWFRIIHSAIRLRDALRVAVAINEAPTADFLGKYNERGYINEISDKLNKLQDMFNDNLDAFRNGKLNCKEKEMMIYYRIVMDEITSISNKMLMLHEEDEREYLISDTKRCININELWEYVDPFVIIEERDSDTIRFLDGDKETVLYTLGE